MKMHERLNHRDTYRLVFPPSENDTDENWLLFCREVTVKQKKKKNESLNK